MVHPADRERINRTTTPKALLEACRVGIPAPSSISIGCSLAKTNSCGSKTACFSLKKAKI
ncbi:MAG: hypothetical protein ACLSAH_03900 [Bilophila wadsworthia]